MNSSLDNAFIPKEAKKEIIDAIEVSKKKKKPVYISVSDDDRIGKFINYQKQNPNTTIDAALDSLNYEKTFFNRFLYNRATTAGNFMDSKGLSDKLGKEMLSYGSISLFILLPIFTLFLKLFYIRKKYTYVEHLIFVFHVQTVFFLLLLIFVLLYFFTNSNSGWIFILAFLIYLFMAMKTFYKQGFFKTFIKYCMLNTVYLILAVFGVSFAAAASFIFM